MLLKLVKIQNLNLDFTGNRNDDVNSVEARAIESMTALMIAVN